MSSQSSIQNRKSKILSSCLIAVGRGVGYVAGLNALLLLTFLALRVPPLAALRALWAGAFGDAQNPHLYRLSETLVETTPLLLTSLGIVVAWRAGLFSIGGQGQLLMGALTALTLSHAPAFVPAPLRVALMVTGGTAAGALWGALAGWLRVRRNVEEVISTIMLNYVAVYVVNWAVGQGGPLQERMRENLASDAIPNALRFAYLLPRNGTGDVQTRLHSGVLLAFLAVPVVSLLLFHTRTGFGLRVLGQNADAARVARFPIDRLRLQAMAISGGLCGLAGVVELLGVSFRLDAQFSSPGWGFTAIPVALLGGLNPFATLGSALFFGALAAGSDNLEQSFSVSSAVINIVQATAVLAVVGIRAWRTHRAGVTAEE